MDMRSFSWCFLFGATFGFFYFFQVSIPMGPPWVEERKPSPFIQKAGSGYWFAERGEITQENFTAKRPKKVHSPVVDETGFDPKGIPIIDQPKGAN
jgi:hypothetical protein